MELAYIRYLEARENNRELSGSLRTSSNTDTRGIKRQQAPGKQTKKHNLSNREITYRCPEITHPQKDLRGSQNLSLADW